MGAYPSVITPFFVEKCPNMGERGDFEGFSQQEPPQIKFRYLCLECFS